MADAAVREHNLEHGRMAEQRKLNDTYVLLEEIGAGGNGVVYKAYHSRLKIYVVVKKIKDQVKGRISDRAEADLLKNLKHTYLPRIYDIFETGGEIYTVIDYIPGQSMDKVVEQNGPIPQKRVLKWAGQLAEALDYLHGLNPPVVHSDIKPSNIMLTPEDNICLIDFNISLALDRSMKDSVGITGGYSPPEQYRSCSQYYSALGAPSGPRKYRAGTATASRPAENKIIRPGSFETVVSGDGSKTSLSPDGARTVLSPANKYETVLSYSDQETKRSCNGEETVLPQRGEDTVLSGYGNETALSHRRDETISSGTGKETVLSDAGSKTLLSSDSNSTVLSGNGSKTILLKVDETELQRDGGATVLSSVSTETTSDSFSYDTKDSTNAAETRRSVTKTGSLIEKTIGQGVDARSDIYSLGATLYHLLTGVRPDNDYEKLTPVDQCGIEISEGFAHIIKKMMELDPDKRYQNGAELLAAFRNIHELDSEYRSWKRRRKFRKVFSAGLIAAGVLLATAGGLMIRNENNVRYNEWIMASEEAIDEGDYEAAASFLKLAEELFPKDIKAYSKEVLLRYMSGDYEECVSYTEELLRNTPFNLQSDSSSLGDIYYILGNACLELEDYSSASLYLETALEYYSGNSFYYRDYAIALAKTGNTDKAEEILETAIDLGLGEDSIYMVQGEIAYAQQNYESAVSYLKQAISYSESDSLRRRAVLLSDKAYRALGTEYLDDEIALLEKEITLNSGAGSAIYERLADAYVRKAESDETTAGLYYEKALEIFESLYDGGYVTSQLMENIAILYEDLDQFDEAENVLLQMVERYPSSYVPYMRLAYLEADRQQASDISNRDYSAMAQYYELALSLYDDNNSDQEMQMLEVMMQELQDGGWLDDTISEGEQG